MLLQLHRDDANYTVGQLVKLLFDENTLIQSTVKGRSGRRPLDPFKIRAIHRKFYILHIYINFFINKDILNP